MTTTVIDLDGVRLTRVLYLDAAIDPEPTGLTPEEVRSVRWADPDWATDGQVRAASCAWVIETDGRRIVVDPSGNIDDLLHEPSSTAAHQEAYAAAFAAAGIPIETVDTVLLSHIESIGLSAVRDGDGWQPYFPNARILLSDAALAHSVAEPEGGDVEAAFAALRGAGLVDGFADGDEVAPGVRAEWTGMHNPGHCAFHVGDGATFVGHLAVTPLHLATGPCPPQHADPDGAWRWLQAAKAGGRILIGPLWPSPGALRWDPANHPSGV
ncbi:hypothetical protein [Aquihabitans sp. McL0605]|uniref:hypothetical protein n=1 Tax=Aquihabitans sp. McL0605 TaxID=3415671 RepID=UPI003CF21455